MAQRVPIKPILKELRKGAKEAEVKRPGQDEFLGKPKDEPETPPPAQEPELEAAPGDEPIAPDQVKPDEKPTTLDTDAEAPELGATPDDPKGPAFQPKNDAPVTDADVERIDDARLENFDLDESFQPNFNTFRTTDDVNAVIADRAARIAPQINEARRGVIKDEQMRALADDLDVEEDVFRAVFEREPGSLDAITPEVIVASRQVLESSAKHIKELARDIRSGEGTDLKRIELRRQLQLHSDFLEQFFTGFMGARAESGRLLRAFGMPLEGSERNMDQIRELVEAASGQDLDRIAAAAEMTDSVAGISKLARKYNQSKFWDVVSEHFVNSILSGPLTQVINAGGNLLRQTMQVTETAVAARLGRFLPGEEHALIGEASAMIHGAISAQRDALILAARSMQLGKSLDDIVKFEGSRRRAISAENLLKPEWRNTPLGRFAEGLLDGVDINIGKRKVRIPGAGPITRFPTERVMSSIDEFFKTIAYRSELERQAFLHAYDQIASGAATANDAARLAREFMENSPLKAQEAAEAYTRVATFQNPLGPTGQTVQRLVNQAPPLKIISPFIRTPIQLFVSGIIDRSPLGIFRKKFFQTMKAGGRERDMMLARIGMGTATSAMVAVSVTDGTVTGSGPSNHDARALLEMSGWQPYSIRITNPFTGKTKYHSYARAEPFAFVIGAIADAVEINSYINSDIETMEDEQQEINNAAAAIIIGISNNTMSKTFMQGMADTAQMLSDPKRYFNGWAKNLATSFMPASALRAQMGRIDDPYLREAWTTLDAIKAKSGIPGYSREAPPRRDLFGEPRMHRSGSLLGTMSPMPDKEAKEDPIVDELIFVMNQTRKVPVSMPSKRVEGLRLDANEYDQLVLISRTREAANGRTFKEELGYLMSRPVYLNATAHMQAELIRDVQSRYDEFARLTLEQEDFVFAAKLAEHRRKQQRLRFGEE